MSALEVPLEGVAIEPLALFLSTARAVDPGLARLFASRAGGSEALLWKIEQEKPWIRDLRIVVEQEGQQVVDGMVRHVSSTQFDPHAEVVELCKLVLSCVPDADLAACRAVDVSGAVSGFGGFAIANKRIPRKSLPSDAEVAWNRSRLRAITTLLSAQTQTERLIAERSLLVNAANTVARAADYWCRRQQLPQSLRQQLSDMAAEANTLPLPPPSTPS